MDLRYPVRYLSLIFYLLQATASPSNDLRLVGGTSYAEGRLEIRHSSSWGTVCDDSWGSLDALVACRQLGFTSVVTALYWVDGGGDPILLDNVQCLGDEGRLSECPHNGWGVHNCVHHEDVAIRCGYANDHAPNGVTFLHLVDGFSHFEGRLEMDYHGVRGGICDTNWTLADATVACRQLGMGTAIRSVPDGTFGTNGNRYYWINSVRCTGLEARLQDCSFGSLALQFCNHDRGDVGVACTGPFVGNDLDVRNAAIRLNKGGRNHSEGRLEIFFNGVWSTVCNTDWDWEDARVACRQLGYSGVSSKYHSVPQLPYTDAPILLDSVRCEGYESTIMGCRHNGFYYTPGCTHQDDVVIKCTEGFWKLSVSKIIGILSGLFVVISLGYVIIKKRMHCEKRRRLQVAPVVVNQAPATGAPDRYPPPPLLLPSPQTCTYPIQPGIQHQQRPLLSIPASIPPICDTSHGPPTLSPSLTPVYHDPYPLPPSYMVAMQGADGVTSLPVYLPSAVATGVVRPTSDIARPNQPHQIM